MKKYSEQDNKLDFSEHVRQSLIKHSIRISPAVLCRTFNQHYHDNNTSIQTASNWLSSVSIPNQDKLQTLANWLSIDIHWLRFGDIISILENSQLSTEQRILFENFALFSPIHQKIVFDSVNPLVTKK